jgi:hypothetical protein
LIQGCGVGLHPNQKNQKVIKMNIEIKNATLMIPYVFGGGKYFYECETAENFAKDKSNIEGKKDTLEGINFIEQSEAQAFFDHLVEYGVHPVQAVKVTECNFVQRMTIGEKIA